MTSISRHTFTVIGTMRLDYSKKKKHLIGRLLMMIIFKVLMYPQSKIISEIVKTWTLLLSMNISGTSFEKVKLREWCAPPNKLMKNSFFGWCSFYGANRLKYCFILSFLKSGKLITLLKVVEAFRRILFWNRFYLKYNFWTLWIIQNQQGSTS